MFFLSLNREGYSRSHFSIFFYRIDTSFIIEDNYFFQMKIWFFAIEILYNKFMNKCNIASS